MTTNWLKAGMIVRRRHRKVHANRGERGVRRASSGRGRRGRKESIARGVPLSLQDQLLDGTGDRVATLCFGWFGGVFGACAGAALSTPTWVRRWQARENSASRGFDVIAAGDDGQGHAPASS